VRIDEGNTRSSGKLHHRIAIPCGRRNLEFVLGGQLDCSNPSAFMNLTILPRRCFGFS
jgi:hypothetical protein